MTNTIMLVHDVFSKEECDNIINNVPFAEEYYKDTEFFAVSPNETTRKDTQYDAYLIFQAMIRKGLGDYYTKIGHVLRHGLERYSENFPIIKKQHIEMHGVNYSEFKLQKTPIGGGFHNWHCEDIVLRDRFLVWSIYLNDITEGGETEFLYQNVRIPARQGSMCVFPSDWTHLHRGNPPISNEKWMLTGWYTYNYNKPVWVHNTLSK
jgi:hypothetical protein